MSEIVTFVCSETTLHTSYYFFFFINEDILNYLQPHLVVDEIFYKLLDILKFFSDFPPVFHVYKESLETMNHMHSEMMKLQIPIAIIVYNPSLI